MQKMEMALINKTIKQQNALLEQRFKQRIVSYNTIAIISGNHLRVIDYPFNIHLGIPNVSRTIFQKSTEGQKHKKSLYRTRSNLIDTINANITPYSKLLTLTCSDDCLDRKVFLERFCVFRKYFQRKFGITMKFVGITERQKERGKKYGNIGSWHIHLAVFMDKYLDFKVLKQCWIYGSIEIHRINNEEGTARYMAKYLTKDELELNEKSILKSYDLKTPLSIPSFNCLSAEMLGCEMTYKSIPRYDLETGTRISKVITEYIIPQHVTFKRKDIDNSINNIS